MARTLSLLCALFLLSSVAPAHANPCLKLQGAEKSTCAKARNELLARAQCWSALGQRLAALAAQKIPADLPSSGKSEYEKQTRWLKSLASRISAAAGKARSAADQMLSSAAQMLEESWRSNQYLLSVQQEMAEQSKQYTMASQLMSTRDEMLKSIIQNVRCG